MFIAEGGITSGQRDCWQKQEQLRKVHHGINKKAEFRIGAGFDLGRKEEKRGENRFRSLERKE